MPKSKFDIAAEAVALTDTSFQLPIPLAYFLGEATDLVAFVGRFFKADKKAGVPGLSSAPAITLDLVAEIQALVAEVQRGQSQYLLTVDPKLDVSKLDRARFVLDELRDALEFYFDDGVQNDDDTRLANLVAAHQDDAFDPDTASLALENFADLADRHRKALDGVGDFDAKLIDEARALAKELRGMLPMSPAAQAAKRLAIEHRNRLLQLLDARVRRVRRAARYVFRHHPAIAQQVSSAYEEKRREAARRAAARKKTEAEPAPPPAG